METCSDELLGLVRDSLEQLGREVQGGGGDVPEGLLVRLAAEGGEAGEEGVGGDPQRPDVGRQADGLVGQDLGGWDGHMS